MIFCFTSGADCIVQFSCVPEYQCLSESVQYQCIVTQSSSLLWRIRDESMVSLGTVSYTTSSNLSPFSNIIGVEQFSTDLSSTSPSLISNISFTVQSSINGYTIQCEDAGGVDTKTCTVDIAGINSSFQWCIIMINFCFVHADPPLPPDMITVEANESAIRYFLECT